MLDTLITDPAGFFEGRRERLDGVRGFVLLAILSVAIVTVVAVATWFLSRQLTGTVTIENPDRPPTAFCEMGPAEMLTESGCDEPARVERRTGAVLWRYFADLLPWLYVGVPIFGLVTAGFLHVGARIAGGDGRAGETLTVVAWGAVPSLVQAVLAGALLVSFTPELDLSASDPEVLTAQFLALKRGFSGIALNGTRLLGTAWQAWVWAGGLAVVHGLRKRTAVALAGLVVLLTLLPTL